MTAPRVTTTPMKHYFAWDAKALQCMLRPFMEASELGIDLETMGLD